MIPKISVIIITYNQEKLISRAIESVLKQKEYIYELIVSDDNSNDNTWSVINAYKSKYPEIIKPFQNPKNLGIFKHIEKTWEYPTGDIVFYLVALMKFCEWFIQKKNFDLFNILLIIDRKNEVITIYFDYISIKPNGRKKVIRNNLITKHNAIELKIRKLISNRTTGISINVIKKFKPVVEIGIFTDGLIDIQTQLFSKKNYYIPFSGSIYYKGIGISSIYDSKRALHSYILMNRKYLEHISGIK
jgi:glycosyltransferase involved in cell wall biosynthesis